jgi:heme exporter protein B
MWKEISVLIRKEITLEWRQKYALNGILLYVVSAVFITYLSVGAKMGNLSIPTWNALFWIILLFSSVNAVAKSFVQEQQGRQLYYYMIASPESIILSKIIFYVIACPEYWKVFSICFCFFTIIILKKKFLKSFVIIWWID